MPVKFPRTRRRRATRIGFVQRNVCCLGSRLMGNLLHVTSCQFVSKPNLIIIRDQNRAVFSAQVRSGGNECDERDPVDFNAPRGRIDVDAARNNKFSKVYEKFDYNDLECQKKLICEVMKEPEYFGNMSGKLKSGFQ